MKVIGTFYGRCDASTWQEAEALASDELLEDMDFKNIQRLSQIEATFPFDFVATKIIRPKTDLYQEIEGEKYLIDVTLRARKRVRRKKLAVWRALGFKTALLIILPEELMAILIEIEPIDNWVTLTPKRIQQLKNEFKEFFTQTKLHREP